MAVSTLSSRFIQCFILLIVPTVSEGRSDLEVDLVIKSGKESVIMITIIEAPIDQTDILDLIIEAVKNVMRIDLTDTREGLTQGIKVNQETIVINTVEASEMIEINDDMIMIMTEIEQIVKVVNPPVLSLVKRNPIPSVHPIRVLI